MGSPDGWRVTWRYEPLRVFLNHRRTHEYSNLHACKQLSFYGDVGTFKNGRMPPWHNALGFLCWGRSLKVHREIKIQSHMWKHWGCMQSIWQDSHMWCGHDGGKCEMWPRAEGTGTISPNAMGRGASRAWHFYWGDHWKCKCIWTWRGRACSWTDHSMWMRVCTMKDCTTLNPWVQLTGFLQE